MADESENENIRKSSMYRQLSDKDMKNVVSVTSRQSSVAASEQESVSDAAANVGKKRRQAPELPTLECKNWLINLHFVRNEMDACKAMIEEQLKDTDGSNEYALFVKGQILQEEGKIQEAFEAFQACARINPTNTKYFKQIARSLFLMGKHKAAIEIFDEALKINAEDWEAYHWKGVCYYNIDERSKAKESLRASIENSTSDLSHTLLGKMLAEEGDLVGAIAVYKAALEIAPENPDMLTTLGLLYMKSGSNQQAFEALGKALGFDPCHSGAILAAGSMMQQHGDFEVALSKYRVAAVDWCDSAQLWSNIAMCFFGKRKFVAAISCLKRANYLAPFDWKILANLGSVHHGMQQYASAFHFLSAAINLQPKCASLFALLAVVLTHLEDHKNAEQAYQHAAQLDSKDPVIPLNYAILLNRIGKTEDAKTWYQEYENRKKGIENLDSEMQEMADKLWNMLVKIE